MTEFENPFAGAPFAIGHKMALTRQHPDTTSYVKDDTGEGKYPRVHGEIVRVGEVDLAASEYHGEEVLKWTIAVACKVINSHDESVQPLRGNNIRSYRRRFPAAFEEYEGRYGKQGLPDAIATVTQDVPRELLGNYDPKTAQNHKQNASAAAKKAALLRQLAALDDDYSEDAERAIALVPEHALTEAEASEIDPNAPIDEFAKVPLKARKKLIGLGVTSVGIFANMSDDELSELGAGQWVKWRLEAQMATGDPRWKQPEWNAEAAAA